MRICLSFSLLLALAGLSAAQDTNFPVGPQYLMNHGSPLFARPIATPSLSLETPLPEVRASNGEETVPGANNEMVISVPELEHQADLFPIYYGVPRVSVVMIGFSEPTGGQPWFRALPASVVDVGVEETTTAQTLRERGYGVTLAEAATYWKVHKVSAVHRYTNEDIERLHGG